MTTCGVLDIAVGNLFCCQCGIEEFGVAVVDHRIVLAVDKEDWRTVSGNMVFQRQKVTKLSVAHTAFSKERPA